MPDISKSLNQKKEYLLRKKQVDNYTRQLVKLKMNQKVIKNKLKDVVYLDKLDLKKLMTETHELENRSRYLERKIGNITKLDSC